MCETKFGTLGQILIEIPKFILKLFAKLLKEKLGVNVHPGQRLRIKKFGISAYVNKGSV